MNMLASSYFYGEIIEGNIYYAYVWWDMSAKLGNEDAERGRLEALEYMKPEQVVKAQKMAQECVKQDYKNC